MHLAAVTLREVAVWPVHFQVKFSLWVPAYLTFSLHARFRVYSMQSTQLKVRT